MLSIRALASPLFGPISLDVGRGRCTAIRGASGSGKSLFLRALADLDLSDGDASLDGVSRAAMAAPQWRRRVMLVPAESGWWDDQVDAHFIAGDDALNRALLAELGFDADVLRRQVHGLSTGERQRLALARALSLRPDALLLDEPSAALDPQAGERVERLLRRELARGVCVLLITHDPAQAERLADDVRWMHSGRLHSTRPDG
jgi:ABC-type multidrug transport system ATPase subunit